MFKKFTLCYSVLESWAWLCPGLWLLKHRLKSQAILTFTWQLSKLYLQPTRDLQISDLYFCFLNNTSTWMRHVQPEFTGWGMFNLNSLSPVQNSFLFTQWTASPSDPESENRPISLSFTNSSYSPHQVPFSESCFLLFIFFANTTKLLTIFHWNYKSCFYLAFLL